MKENKFRVWNKEHKEWIYFDLNTLLKRYVIDERSSIVLIILREKKYQYTGLKDGTKWNQLTKKEQKTWLDTGQTEKKWAGKEIYEGDIIQHEYIGSDEGFPTYGKKQIVKQIIRFELLEAGDDMDMDSYGYHINPYWNGDFRIVGNVRERRIAK